MAGGYRSPLAFWVGGASAPPATTQAGVRSLVAPWMGGASAPTAPATHHREPDGPPGSTPAAGARPGPTLWVHLLVLLGILILFASVHGQSGGALLFFARDAVDRRILGRSIPPDFFAAVPAAMVLHGVRSMLWR